MVSGARLKRFAEAGLEVGLFGVAEDAAREAGEVVWSSEETAYARDVDDICADVEGEWEGQWFHVWVSSVESCEGEV